MKCTSCGADLDSNARFCTNCGKGVDVTQQAQPTPVQPTPVATYTNTGQPQPQKKKSNVALIVVLVILGFFIVGAIVIALLVRMFIANVAKEIEDLDFDTPISDIVDDTDDEKVYKTVKDPTGHEIKIIEDDIYIYEVKTDYLYDTAREMRKKAKVATTGDIEKLDATDKEKEATKKVLEKLNAFSFSTKPEIEKYLKDNNYSQTEIEFALEHSGADWDEQAKIEAITILAAGGFSKQEVIDLMIYDGYTPEEAAKAVEDDSLDFYEQAAYDACFLRFTSSKYGSNYSKDDARQMLEYDEYTQEEIDFALKLVYDEMN